MNTKIIVYQHCPLCNSQNIKYANTFKDEFLSKENFELWQCLDCDFHFTQNVPSLAHIGKYYESEEYVSHNNTQQGIVYKLYNIVRTQMLLTKKRWIKKYATPTSNTLLDIGCGTGHFAKIMQEASFDVVGVEPNATAVALARQNMRTEHIYSNIHEVAILNKKFDVITLFHVLEHLHYLHDSFAQIQQMLSDNGLIVIAIPNRKSTDAMHYQMNWAAYDMPRHLWHFSYKNIQQLVQKYNMEIIDYKPMIFDSFYVSLLSEKQYSKSKWYLIKGFWWGKYSFLMSWLNRKKSSSLVYFIKRKK